MGRQQAAKLNDNSIIAALQASVAAGPKVIVVEKVVEVVEIIEALTMTNPNHVEVIDSSLVIMRFRLVAQHDVVAAPALTLLLHQLLPRKQALLLEELITFRSENVHTGDCRKWKCPYLLHGKAVEARDATINKAELSHIGEMQKPKNSIWSIM